MTIRFFIENGQIKSADAFGLTQRILGNHIIL